MVTGISEGSLYIDVDTDSHSVISLEEDSDVAREYFLSTGMVSSLYESTVWEDITGQESVSTVSILARASEENIDILLLSKANLSTEIEKLNTDETTKQSIMNAVNSGMMVTVPAEEVTMGEWSGTGYIVTNPKTGVGEYMISGGLNGGITKYILGLEELVITICSAIALAVIITTLAGILSGLALVGCAALILVAWFVINYMMWTYYMEYFFEGDLEAGEISETEMEILIVYTVLLQSVVILPFLGENRQPDTESGNSGGASEQGDTIGGEENGNNTIPDKAWEIARQVKANNGAPPNGYKGGRIYRNIPLEDGVQKLPDGVNYREYNINPYVEGQNRGAERIVIGDDGSVCYTNDHYNTFTRME